MTGNFKTIIRTNRWGFGIHSPFVFRLVTRVIFGNPDRTREINPGTLNREEKRKMEMIIRMIRFFMPESIHAENRAGFLQSTFGEKYRDGHVIKSESLNIFEKYSLFRIISQRPPENIEFRGNEIMVLTELKDSGVREYFRELQDDPRVTITIEVKNMGIVIINPAFQKQNFYVRNWLL